MYENFEVRVLLAETKGLLRELETMVRHTKMNLAFDNISNINDELDQMRKLMNIIEDKIKIETKVEDDDELV